MEKRRISLDVRFSGHIIVDAERFEENELKAIREAIERGDYEAYKNDGYVIQGNYHRYENTDEDYYVEDEIDF